MESKGPDKRHAHAQDGRNPRILRMLEGTFSLDDLMILVSFLDSTVHNKFYLAVCSIVIGELFDGLRAEHPKTWDHTISEMFGWMAHTCVIILQCCILFPRQK